MYKQYLLIIGLLFMSFSYGSYKDLKSISPAKKQTTTALLKKREYAAKGYTCGICGFKGKWRGDKLRHKRTHEDKRPHRCGYCSQAFGQSYDRTLHENRHTLKEKTEAVAVVLVMLASIINKKGH